MNADAMNTFRRLSNGLLIGAAIIVVPVCVAPTCAFAQPSTERLTEQGRKLAIDISVGTESVDFGTVVNVERERGAGRLLALSVGARWRLSAGAGISATGFVLRRPSSARFYFPEGTPPRADGHEVIVAVGPTLDVQARLAGPLLGALLAGIGIVPTARNSATNTSQSGVMPMLGVQLRYRRLTLTQHLLFLQEAELVIQTRREFYPISLGWRF